MTLRIIEVSCKRGHADTIIAAGQVAGAVDARMVEQVEGGYETLRLVVESKNSQRILDAIQRDLHMTENWRINIIPLEATLPRPMHPTGDRESDPGAGATRAEIYNDVAANADMSPIFVLMVVLSTAVAAIGLLNDNIAVVIGAMIVAPLLGPNLAFGLGAALGDRRLMVRALRTNGVGLAITLAISVALGFVIPHPESSAEMISRTEVGLGGVALAFASGMAAALSLTTGISSALVGVMVAVALLPPAATAGIMLGAERYELAVGAALLLAVNVVAVNLATQLVFVFRGIRPHRWYERREGTSNSWFLAILVWGVLLALLVAYIVLRGESVLPQ